MAKSPRLTRNDWLQAGFAALMEAGPGALKAELMARRLGTTKGSFYWHFKDVPDFHTAMMAHWEERCLAEIADAVEAEAAPRDRLRRLGQIAGRSAEKSHDGAAVEPGIRAWARSDAAVADAVARIDGLRHDYIAGLLGELALTNPDFAHLIHAALIGLEDLASRDASPVEGPLATLIDLILALE